MKEGFGFTCIFILITVIIIIIAARFSKRAIVKRRLKKATYRKVSFIKDGETAKVVGEVELIDEPLFSPLSKRKCAYYYVHVEQKISSGKHSHWDTIVEEEVSCKFVIRDGIDCAVINRRNLKSYIVQDKEYSSGFLHDATDELENYLNSKGYDSEGFLGMNKTLRYREGILEPGEVIAAYGKCQWKDVTELNLPDSYGRVLEINSSEEEPVFLSDAKDTTIKEKHL